MTLAHKSISERPLGVNRKSAHPTEQLDGSDNHDINEAVPDKPVVSAIRSFHSVDSEISQLPPCPPGVQSSHKQHWRDLTAPTDVIGPPGPSLSLLLLSGESAPHEPEGEGLPEGDLKAIDSIHDIHDTQHREIASYLFHEAMDGDWYEDKESTHIAVVSSVGKAEHAMRCLNHDIKRYTRLICRLCWFLASSLAPWKVPGRYPGVGSLPGGHYVVIMRVMSPL